MVGDKGYHSNRRSWISKRWTSAGTSPNPTRKAALEEEPRGPRRRVPQSRRIRGERGKRLLRRRGERWNGPLRISMRPAACDGRTSAGTEHPQAAADSRRRLQSRTDPAATDRRRHAARPPGAFRRALAGLLTLIGTLREAVTCHRSPVQALFTTRTSLDREKSSRAYRHARTGFRHGLLRDCLNVRLNRPSSAEGGRGTVPG